MGRLKENGQRISYSFVFSLTIHIVFSLIALKAVTDKNQEIAQLFAQNQVTQKNSSIKLDSIKFISKNQLKAIKDSQNRQIVANEQNGKEEAPLNSRFLGEKNQKYDRQSLARKNDIFKEAGRGSKEGKSLNATTQAQAEVKKPSSQKRVDKDFK